MSGGVSTLSDVPGCPGWYYSRIRIDRRGVAHTSVHSVDGSEFFVLHDVSWRQLHNVARLGVRARTVSCPACELTCDGSACDCQLCMGSHRVTRLADDRWRAEHERKPQ